MVCSKLITALFLYQSLIFFLQNQLAINCSYIYQWMKHLSRICALWRLSWSRRPSCSLVLIWVYDPVLSPRKSACCEWSIAISTCTSAVSVAEALLSAVKCKAWCHWMMYFTPLDLQSALWSSRTWWTQSLHSAKGSFGQHSIKKHTFTHHETR